MKKLFVLLIVSLITTGAFAQNDKKMDTTHKMKSEKMLNKDCVMMKDGKMMMMKEGKTMDMDNDVTMKNGTTVMKDGTVKMKDGKTMMMKNGDCMYMNGKMAKMDKMKNKM
ncbi:MAG: DUF6799 domain-containing protein [Ginsengibacter sp.]